LILRHAQIKRGNEDEGTPSKSVLLVMNSSGEKKAEIEINLMGFTPMGFNISAGFYIPIVPQYREDEVRYVRLDFSKIGT
jgi:hypothetical protein